MAKYITTSCPLCGYKFEYRELATVTNYGNPYRICQKCGTVSFDSRMRELSISGFDKTHVRKVDGLTIGMLIFGIVALIVGLVEELVGRDGSIFLWMGIFFSAVYTFVLVLSLKEYRQTTKTWLIEYEQSRLRTSNPQHIVNLRKNGYPVYENFFPRELTLPIIQSIFGNRLEDIDVVWAEVKWEMGNQKIRILEVNFRAGNPTKRKR